MPTLIFFGFQWHYLIGVVQFIFDSLSNIFDILADGHFFTNLTENNIKCLCLIKKIKNKINLSGIDKE